MPIAELCVVCGDRLRVNRNRHTRHCRSTCRVRALRARRSGADLSALQAHYMALRAQAVSLSLPGRDPIASASLRPLTKVMQRAGSLAAQLVDQRQQAAQARAQLALVDQAAQQERVERERTQELLNSLSTSQSHTKADLSAAHTALTQTRQQLKQVQWERDQARTSEQRLAGELKPLRERLQQAEHARDAAQQALTAPRPTPPTMPSAELVKFQRAAQEWQAYAAHLKTELGRQTQHVQQVEGQLKRLAAEHEAERARRTADRAAARADAVEAQPTQSPSAVDSYDPAQDGLLWHKRNEIEASDELESWATGTGRRRPQKKSLDQRAFEAAHAARCALLADRPKGYRKPISWSIPERVLDAASEKYLIDQSVARSAELFVKLPLAARRKGR